LVYRATLLGADADVVLGELRGLFGELFVKAPAAQSSAQSVSAMVGERATAQ
jgi:hypothetical protein